MMQSKFEHNLPLYETEMTEYSMISCFGTILRSLWHQLHEKDNNCMIL